MKTTVMFSVPISSTFDKHFREYQLNKMANV